MTPVIADPDTVSVLGAYKLFAAVGPRIGFQGLNRIEDLGNPLAVDASQILRGRLRKLNLI